MMNKKLNHIKLFEEYKHIGDKTMFSDMSRDDFFSYHLTTQKEAESWILELIKRKLDFHLDDDPSEILKYTNGEYNRLFSDYEAEMVQQRITELFGLLEDPYDLLYKNVTGKYQGVIFKNLNNNFENEKLHQIEYSDVLDEYIELDDKLDNIIHQTNRILDTHPKAVGIKIIDNSIINSENENVIWYRTKDMNEGKYTKYYYVSKFHNASSAEHYD